MFTFRSARRKPGWLSILMQDGQVTLVHVLRRPGVRPEVTLLESFSLESGERDALSRLKSSRQLKSYACTTLLGNGEYHIAQFDAPPVPREERKEALRWSLRDVVNYPVETACVDVLDIPGDGLPGRTAAVLVVAASERAVRARAAPFEEARLALQCVDIPELAQRNVAALLEDENRGLAFLRLDENGMMLTLTFRGELVAVRRGEMNTQQLNGSDPEQRARIRERLVLEVQRSLDNFDRQYSYIPVSKVVLACQPSVEGLTVELAANIYVPVQQFDLSPVMDFTAVPELRDVRCQARNLLAIGAALRTDEGTA